MGRHRRLSDESAAVLSVLAQDAVARFGRDLILETGIRSGSLYPILRRLEKQGLLVGEWEHFDTAAADGRRPRRYYSIAPGELDHADRLLTEWHQATKVAPKPAARPAWN